MGNRHGRASGSIAVCGEDMRCPKCGAEMERFDEEPDVGITGSYECECGESLPLSEGERDEE